MNGRFACFVMLLPLLLAVWAPLGELSASVDADDEVVDAGPRIEWVNIVPDPNSIRGAEPTSFSEGNERVRLTQADTRLGTYGIAGLELDRDIPAAFSAERSDLRLVLIDGEVGLWPAQEALSTISGLMIRAYIPPSGFLVQGDAFTLSSLASLSPVVAVHPVPSAMLVEDELLDLYSEDLAPVTDSVEVRLEGWRHLESGVPVEEFDIGAVTHSTGQLAGELLDSVETIDAGRHQGALSLADLLLAAFDPSISWIRLPPVFAIHNDRARIHMRIPDVVNAFATTLNGSGEIIAVADSGIDQDHGDMDNRIVAAVSVVNGDSSSEDTHSGHGTHVACTVLGDGSRGGYAGVAPGAELYFQAMERDSDGQFYSPSMNYLINAAYNNGALTHTNSWGSQTNYGEYTTDSEDVDDRVNYYDQYWSYDGMTVLFSAGNDGSNGNTISPPATAKNQLAVANHHNRGGGAPDSLATTSSRGPVDDGRLKPDVAAPGAWVRSCRSQDATDISGASWSSQWYLEYSGTSMAAPNTAGASALIREYLKEVAGRPEPQGALVRGLIILGAEDMGTRDIPNMNEGWGRVNLANSLVPGQNTGIYVDDRNYLRSGNSRDYTFNISESWKPFKVVLSWSDYRGNRWASTQLQNDLDLTVTAPDGTTTYLGNVFQNGRSSTGGSTDTLNNIEVVLVDQAQKGIWTVHVEDVRHGGQRSQQTYALAVRGAGVDDLSPDAAFVPNSFQLSDPIPQVNEQVTFSLQVTNMGSRTMDDLVVRTSAGSQNLGDVTINLGPGEIRGLNWQWTPTSSGTKDIIIQLDPTDAFSEELDEGNNLFLLPVGVTEPGVRLDTDTDVVTLTSAESSTTQWDIQLKNTALLPTNASISATKPIRLSDGTQFDWFQSFSQTTFALNGSEVFQVGLTLVHPPPTEPGLYRFTVTATDEDNGIQYPLTLTLDVPVLPDLHFTVPFSELTVSPVANTSFSVDLWNDGNGAQGWDLDLFAPNGWHFGFDDLGSMPGAPSASSGYISAAGTRTLAITVVPPSTHLVSAGTQLVGTLRAVSQIDTDSEWSQQISFVVATYRNGSIELESEYGQLRSDGVANLRFTVTNTGNDGMTLTPSVELPGGWSVTNNLPAVELAPGQSGDVVVGIAGNGLAQSGPFQLTLTSEDGYRLEWEGVLDVIAIPRPLLSFSSVIMPDGSSSPEPLGAGDHPAGAPGVRLIWFIENAGSEAWTPSVYLRTPSAYWMAQCDAPEEISAGGGQLVECLVMIPTTLSAGEQPQLTFELSVAGLEINDTISLRVASSKAVQWTVKPHSELVEGVTTEVRIEAYNAGNAPLSHRIALSGTDGWKVSLTGSSMLELQPGETRTLVLQVTPDEPEEGYIQVWLQEAADVFQNEVVYSVSAEDDPNRVETPSSGSSGLIWAGLVLLLVALAVASGVLVKIASSPKDGSVGRSRPPPPMSSDLPSPPSMASLQPAAPVTSDLPPPPSAKAKPAAAPPVEAFAEESDDSDRHRCWVCLESLSQTEWQACPGCGARYHLSGGGCAVDRLSGCRNCERDVSEFVTMG